MAANFIPIIEVFGPTIQGEGPLIGQKVCFIRTAGCDYQCAWCDSAFTWNGTEKDRIRKMDPSDVLAELVRVGGENFNYITISGGNPVLIGEPMNEFIDLAHDAGYKLSLETQGSKWQNWILKVDDVVVSPKPPSSKMKTDYLFLREFVETQLAQGKGTLSLKVVIMDDADYEYAHYVRNYFPQVPFYLQVGNPEPTASGNIASMLLDRYSWLIDKVLADPEFNDVRVLPQLHTLVWSNKRGV